MGKKMVLVVSMLFILFGCMNTSSDNSEKFPEIKRVSLLGSINKPGIDAWEPKEQENEMVDKGNGIFEKEMRVTTLIADWIAKDVPEANFAVKFAANNLWAKDGGIEWGAEKDKIKGEADGKLIKTTKDKTVFNLYLKLEPGAQYKFTLDTKNNTYKIEQTEKALNNDARLSTLEIKDVKILPDFNSATLNYSCETEQESVIIEAKANYSAAKVEGIGSKSLVTGNNTFIIAVTAENGIDKNEYKIDILRKYVDPYELIEKAQQKIPDELKKSNANITIDGDKISIIGEKLTLPKAIGNVKIDWMSDNNSIIDVSGKITQPEYEEGDQEVILAANLIFEDKNVSKQFLVTVKAKEWNVAIKKISLAGTIYGTGNDSWDTTNPNFEMADKGKGIYEKELTVTTLIASWVTGEVPSANYAFKFAGNGAWAKDGGFEYGVDKKSKKSELTGTLIKTKKDGVAYNVFVNLIPGAKYKFTFDTNTDTYRIEKTADPLNSNSRLKSLGIENNEISPVFSATEYSYTALVTTSSINIIAVCEDSKSKIEGSGIIELDTDKKEIKVVVTAEDGSKSTYTLFVTRIKI